MLSSVRHQKDGHTLKSQYVISARGLIPSKLKEKDVVWIDDIVSSMGSWELSLSALITTADSNLFDVIQADIFRDEVMF